MLKYSPFAALAAILLASPAQALADEESWHERHAREYRWERHHHTKPEERAVPRNDLQTELPTSNTPTPSKPATGNMGVGSTDIALGLAKASLASHGIHNPTPEQIKVALNGGTVTTKSGQRVTLPGVMKLRASGMGWGEIAHKLGMKVGDVKRHDHKHVKHHDRDDDDDRHHHRKHVKHDGKHKHDKHDRKHDRHERKHDRHDRKHEHVKHHHHRPDFHRAKFERPERSQRPDKVERPQRTERPERPERRRHRD